MNKLLALLFGLLIITSPAHAVLSEVYSDAAWKNLADFASNAAASEVTKAFKAVDTSEAAFKAASSSKALSRLKFADKFKKLSIVYKVGTSYGMVDINGAEILDFIRIIDHLCEGQWQDAGNQGFDTLLGYFVPAYCQYMALHGMVKTSVTAVVSNWTESLYETKAYRSAVDLMNQTILERAKQKLPFIPTILIRDTPVDDATLTTMATIENDMYTRWMANSPDIELGTGSNPARLRQVLGHDPENDREIFDLFFQKAVGDQLGYIQVTCQRVAKQAAEAARQKFYEQTVRELNAFMDRNARPENVGIAYAAETLTVSFDGMPGYAYKTGVYLTNSENREIEDKRIYYETIVGTEARNTVSFPFTLADPHYDSVQTIIADRFGRSRGAETPLSPAAVKIGKIKQTFDDYGGRPVDGSVQNGEIIAFQSQVQLPAFDEKMLTTLTWQVYRADASPVSGLTKTMSTLEAGTKKDMRFRFRLDSMPEGDYYTQLSVCPQGQECRMEKSSFTIRQSIAVTALNLATDKEETRLSNGIFKNNDTAYAFAHYETSADKVKVRLTVRDKTSGKVVQRLEGEKAVDKTKADKRAGILLNLNRLKVGTPYEITAAFSSPDGKSAVKTASFSKAYYGLDISPYLDLKEGESRNFSVALEKGLTPPLTLNVSSSNGSVIASGSGQTPAFRVVNPPPGLMKIRVTVKGANGGIAENSYDTYVSAKPKPVQKPLLAEEIPTVAPLKQEMPIVAASPQATQTNSARPSNNGQVQRPHQKNAYDVGVKRMRTLLTELINLFVPPCGRHYYQNFVETAVNNLSREELIRLGTKSDYYFSRNSSFWEALASRTRKTIGDFVYENMAPDECGKQWARLVLLHENGDRYTKFLARERKYYAGVYINNRGEQRCFYQKGPITASTQSGYQYKSGQQTKINYEIIKKSGPLTEKEAKEYCVKINW